MTPFERDLLVEQGLGSEALGQWAGKRLLSHAGEAD